MTTSTRVSIRPPTVGDGDLFLAAAVRSVDLHHPWVVAPTTPEAYAAYLARLDPADHPTPRNLGLLVLVDGDLAGWVNINEIVRGAMLGGSLGYAAFVPWQGRGVMREGVRQVIDHAFADPGGGGLGLHRIEVNVQPANEPSRRLAEGLGLRREGFSPRFLKIDGDWRDHDRFAITVEEWGPLRDPAR